MLWVLHFLGDCIVLTLQHNVVTLWFTPVFKPARDQEPVRALRGCLIEFLIKNKGHVRSSTCSVLGDLTSDEPAIGRQQQELKIPNMIFQFPLSHVPQRLCFSAPSMESALGLGKSPESCEKLIAVALISVQHFFLKNCVKQMTWAFFFFDTMLHSLHSCLCFYFLPVLGLNLNV